MPARLTLDVVRALPAAEVSLELRPTDQDVEIVSGSATFHIRTLRSEDFPPLPEPGGDAVVEVPAAAFVETVARVARSASRDETRPILTGILVSAAGRELRMVATDSYRLSVKETPLEPSSTGPSRRTSRRGRCRSSCASPSRRATRRARSASGVRANQVVFEVGGAVLSSRLIDGQFPNYRQLLPDSYEHELRIAGQELTDVVRRISLLAQKNAPLRLAFREGELTVSAQTPDVGEAARRARGVRRRSVRDRLQPGVPARRPGERRVGRSGAEADQPAAARA